LAHEGKYGTGAVEGTFDIDIKDEVEVFFRDVVQIAGRTEGSTGRSDQDVDRSQLGCQRLHGGFDGATIADIHYLPGSPMSERVEMGNSFVYALHINDCHRGARLGCSQSDSPA
jgi:hypothetical protein